jgi:hypothetical protein
MVKSDNRNVYVSMVTPMIEYYDKAVTNNKQSVNALRRYKYSDYIQVNQMLLGKPVMEFSLYEILSELQRQTNQADQTKSNRSDRGSKKDLSIYDIHDHLTNMYQKELTSLVSVVKTLDKIIIGAPKTPFDVVVFRGIKTDIYDDFVCKDGEFYWTSPTYLSTSFSENVSNSFKSRHGIMMKLSLPNDSHGIFLPWSIPLKGSIGDSLVDSEYELLLPRGSTFFVESIEYIKSDSHKISSKYRNIPCEKKYPLITKVYNMRLISQPSLADLKRDYARMTKNVEVKLESWDLKEINIDMSKKKSPKTLQKSL